MITITDGADKDLMVIISMNAIWVQCHAAQRGVCVE